jgi:transcriptional regulator of acetoin/glycerol metabolism
MLHDWPGNVRELENAIERAVVVGKGRIILPQDLPILRPEQASVPSGRSLADMERAHVIRVLTDNQWNIARSADVLGIDRSTLYGKMKRYHIRKPS